MRDCAECRCRLDGKQLSHDRMFTLGMPDELMAFLQVIFRLHFCCCCQTSLCSFVFFLLLVFVLNPEISLDVF